MKVSAASTVHPTTAGRNTRAVMGGSQDEVLDLRREHTSSSKVRLPMDFSGQ